MGGRVQGQVADFFGKMLKPKVILRCWKHKERTVLYLSGFAKDNSRGLRIAL
jgi:hypothetical protein